MQYFFHIHEDGNTITDDDPEGTEFGDMQGVRAEALTSIRGILAQALQGGTESREGKMIVTDQSGETILTVPFSMRVRLG